MVEKLYEIDILVQCKSVVEVCLIHEMSYSFAIYSITFLVKILSVEEILNIQWNCVPYNWSRV